MKWSGKHVPNSPFNVQIFKALADLEAFLASNPTEQVNLKVRQDFYLNNESFKAITANAKPENPSAKKIETIESLL